VSDPPKDDDDKDDEKTAEKSRSIDVQFSHPSMPKAEESQSIDVQFSGHKLPVRRPRGKTIPGKIAESFTNLPVVKEVMPKSRRGRVLVRSVFVGFALVATWIGVIVYWQLRKGDAPDLRPQVEAILVGIRDGRIAEVYDNASPKFQELVLEDTFVAQMDDLNSSLGDFKEVASVTKTQTFRGASGRTARVELLLDFEKDSEMHRARASMSFRLEDGQWRMIGFDLELPEDVAKLEMSDAARKKRVKAPKEIEDLTRQVLELSRDGKYGEIYDATAPVFQESIEREDFLELEQRRREEIGPFLRILRVMRATQNPAQNGASLDALLEYNAGNGKTVTVTGNFKYSKVGGVWKLAFYRIIMPIPHGTTP
jgi:hypothetical protein